MPPPPAPVEHSELHNPINCAPQCLELLETKKGRSGNKKKKKGKKRKRGIENKGRDSRRRRPEFPGRSRLPSSANSPLLLVVLEFAARFSLPPNSIPASSASNPLPAALRPRIHFPQLVVCDSTSPYSPSSKSPSASHRPRTHLPPFVGPRIVFA